MPVSKPLNVQRETVLDHCMSTKPFVPVTPPSPGPAKVSPEMVTG